MAYANSRGVSTVQYGYSSLSGHLHVRNNSRLFLSLPLTNQFIFCFRVFTISTAAAAATSERREASKGTQRQTLSLCVFESLLFLLLQSLLYFVIVVIVGLVLAVEFMSLTTTTSFSSSFENNESDPRIGIMITNHEALWWHFAFVMYLVADVAYMIFLFGMVGAALENVKMAFRCRRSTTNEDEHQVASMEENRPSRRLVWNQRIVSIAVIVLDAYLFIKCIRLKFLLQDESVISDYFRNQKDPLLWTFLELLACGIIMEVILYWSTAYVAPIQVIAAESGQERQKSSSRLLVNRRFSFFLLFLATLMLFCGFKKRLDHQYDFRGPLRLTRLPKLFTSRQLSTAIDDPLINFPCLKDARGGGSGSSISKDDDGPLVVGEMYEQYYQQASVRVTLEVGWEESWICPHKISSQWHTIWPIWDTCSTLLCQNNTPSSCACAKDVETARNSTWNCLYRHFPTLNLLTNDTNTTLERINQAQRPWEDPRDWPVVSFYVRCDGKFGRAMSTYYVDAELSLAQRQLHVGATTLIVWFVLVIFLIYRERQHKTARQLREENEACRHEEWQRLLQARTDNSTAARNHTIYIGQQLDGSPRQS